MNTSISRIQSLTQALPEGLLVDSRWMERHGYSSSLRGGYVERGWLQKPARGVFRQPRGALSWDQAVLSLQTLLRYPVSVGARTALDLQSLSHYVPRRAARIHLYSPKRLPAWLHALSLEQTFAVRDPRRLFAQRPLYPDGWSLDVAWSPDDVLDGELRALPWGQWRWPFLVSTPERAYLELLDELPKREDFHMADVLMENLSNLQAPRLQRLLENTRSVKVKRLFLFFADRHRHAWLDAIDRDRIDLGRGKRMLVRGGRYDAAHRITVPEELLEDASRNPDAWEP